MLEDEELLAACENVGIMRQGNGAEGSELARIVALAVWAKKRPIAYGQWDPSWVVVITLYSIGRELLARKVRVWR